MRETAQSGTTQQGRYVSARRGLERKEQNDNAISSMAGAAETAEEENEGSEKEKYSERAIRMQQRAEGDQIGSMVRVSFHSPAAAPAAERQ